MSPGDVFRFTFACWVVFIIAGKQCIVIDQLNFFVKAIEDCFTRHAKIYWDSATTVQYALHCWFIKCKNENRIYSNRTHSVLHIIMLFLIGPTYQDILIKAVKHNSSLSA